MDEIKNLINRTGKALSINEICELTKRNRKDIQNEIDELVATFELIETKGNKFALPKQIGAFIGKLSVNPKGFGFLAQEKDDIFIAEGDLEGAMNGDIAMVRIKKASRGRRDGKAEGVVVDILQHAHSTVVGTVTKQANAYLLIPADRKLRTAIYIDYLKDAKEDDVVILQITRYASGAKIGAGKVVNIIGNKDDNRIDILSTIASFDIPMDFKDKTIKEAANVDTRVMPTKNRVDYRDEMTITIDGADAKDLDDAISFYMENDNYVLTVHIADVSHYVVPGSSLDKEAESRGNSVYFPGKVIPMLPKELSNGICSLHENVDRYTLSCKMVVNKDGRVIDTQVNKGIIRSDHRMTYDDVNKIIAGDSVLCEKYSDIVDMIHDMKHLMQTLFNNRLLKGSLEFEIPETAFKIADDGKVLDVYARKRGVSEQMIEEFMLLANKSVCLYMENFDLPIMFRVHEPPTEEKAEIFAGFVNAYGFKFGKQNITSKKMQDALNAAIGTPYKEAMDMVALRTMSKARYSTVNYGHFGLAFEDYCHFTSPIRRYADLLIHRFLSDHFQSRASKIGNLQKVALHISETEKNAMEAEYHVDDIYCCYYMKQFVGEEFEGKISGISPSGFYVELANTCEGMVRASSIRGDYYVFQEKLFQMIGERTRKIFRMGDKVRVVITKVNPEMGQIDMELID